VLNDADIDSHTQHIGVVILRQYVFDQLNTDPKRLLLRELHQDQKIDDKIHPLAIPYIRVTNRQVPKYRAKRLFRFLILLIMYRPNNILVNRVLEELRVVAAIGSKLLVERRVLLDPVERPRTQQPNRLTVMMRPQNIVLLVLVLEYLSAFF